MALDFSRQHPPTDQIMMFYGAEFPHVIGSFVPAQEIASLTDFAWLEDALPLNDHTADAQVVPAALIAWLDEGSALVCAKPLCERLSLAGPFHFIGGPWHGVRTAKSGLRNANDTAKFRNSTCGSR